MEKIYEDEEVELYAGLDIEGAKREVLAYLLRVGRARFEEIRSEFSGIVGEDRLRKALRELVRTGVVLYRAGYYYAPTRENMLLLRAWHVRAMGRRGRLRRGP